jgi:long-chain acyl-CoA synthetase
MDKPWLKSYPEGVPAEIAASEYPSLASLIESACDRYAAQPAYYNMGVGMSYAELGRQSAAFGAWLQREAGLEKGDRVAIMLPNVLQYPVALFGVLRAGLVAVNVNPLYSARELRHQLTDSGAKAIVVMENFATTVEEVLGDTQVRTVVTTEIGDLFPVPKRVITNLVVKHVKKMVPPFRLPDRVRLRDVLKAGAGMTLRTPDIEPGDLAFLQYTGGTTGLAKGAMLSHRNMLSNIEQSVAWLGTALHDVDVVAIAALPLYHIFSLEGNCLSILRLGGANVLITNPRDFPGFVKELSHYPFVYFTGVNTLFNALLHTPGFADLDFSHLRITIGGGMAVQEKVAREWKQVTGNTLTQAYGLTETSPAAVINPLSGGHEFNHSIGLPIPSTDVSIRDDDGNALPPGEIGEICIRGPQVMEGYWHKPDETARVMIGDWLRTGDMGRLDEHGYVFVEDRKKDMILVSGFNVYPNEVEDVVASLDGVLEVAAIGKPDERAGEVVKLFVVRSDPALTADAIMAHCRKNLAGYKVPKEIEFRDELPKTNIGKVLRRALRDAA